MNEIFFASFTFEHIFVIYDSEVFQATAERHINGFGKGKWRLDNGPNSHPSVAWSWVEIEVSINRIWCPFHLKSYLE